ncbi:serine/threonine-protein kinase [Gloeocapsopsis dulcis]|uniref:Serine/threonine-protein kinase B n=1 Tax=Gloeocapsopsis dulcis AAB1 = 1H9 TaxID=1433147 RepID=A0A6N8FRQ1_9CHRO|nr:serine/threonine-protein kinase [Gloeocapsopsis dulcis]MUL35262.1 serine/threonine protein kinase [Gloeocapsopsis dulcis AAB1 = 1H9]WNN89143.1 serine/threonine-protein kinase [Gloeocapsopsis dulcis]
MSYCLNPDCSHPQNPVSRQTCATCGTQLLLRDRYHALQALAQGGFGATFLAQDVTLPGEPKCVIKQLRPSATSLEALDMARKLFAREAKTLGKIGSHPQVPRLLDYFEDTEQFYLIQEYINGLTLQQEIKRSGPVSEAGVKQFLSEILPTLQYIHSQQVIHRDIKPANIIRRHEDCKLVLIDFGAVKDQVSQTTSMSENTALTAFAVGTPGFAPPEQLAMRPVYASDVYALGVTCIYLLTGKSPKDLEYNSSTGEMLWQNKVQISDRFREVLQKMVEGAVRHRYQSPNDVLTALELEPYMNSLANSMAAQPSAVRKPKLPRMVKQTTPTTSPISTAVSTASVSSAQSRTQIADAIRARRANLTEVPNTLGQPFMPSAIGQKTKVAKPRKLDADNLVLSYIKGRRDFASYDLSLLDLQRIDLSAVNFRAAKLDRTNFFKCILSSNDFSHASLKRTNFRETILIKAYFHSADLEGADFRGANLSYADLSDANLRNVNLCGANLTGAKVSDEQLAHAKVNWMTVRPNGKRGWL